MDRISRQDTRDAANDKMMNDPDAMAGMADMPFDGKRMIFSGFTPILNQGSLENMGYIDGYVIPVSNVKKAIISKSPRLLRRFSLNMPRAKSSKIGATM